MTRPDDSHFDPADLVRRHEAKLLAGITSSGVLGEYPEELGHIIVGKTHFWSRTRCLAWRALRPNDLLCTAEVASMLGVSTTLLTQSYDQFLQPEMVTWGHHGPIRSYDRDRVLRMKAIRDRVLASGRKTVPWSAYAELDAPSFDTSDAYRDASQPSQLVPDSIGLGLAPTITDTVTRGQKPRQIVRPRSGKASRIGEAVRSIKDAAVAGLDRKKTK